MQFVIDHAAEIGAALVALATIINRLTRHWNNLDMPEWKRGILLFTELFSVLASKDKTTKAGGAKLPLTNADSDKVRDVSPISFILLVLLFLGGCAGSTWTSTARATVDAANDTAKIAWSAYFPRARKACLTTLNTTCKDKSQGYRDCEEFQKCYGHIRAVSNVVENLHSTVAVLRSALDTYDSAMDPDEALAEKDRIMGLVRRVLALVYMITEIVEGDIPGVDLAAGDLADDGGVDGGAQ